MIIGRTFYVCFECGARANRGIGPSRVHHAAAGTGALQHRGNGFEDREMGDEAKGDTVKLQGEDKRRAGRSIQREDAEPEPITEPALDQEAIARLAYSYWEDRGGQDGSPEEDWFRAEAELRNGKKPNHHP